MTDNPGDKITLVPEEFVIPVIYEFVNKEDIPSDLPTGHSYTTQVVEAEFKNGKYVIRLKYIGDTYSSSNPQCLFPIVVK